MNEICESVVKELYNLFNKIWEMSTLLSTCSLFRQKMLVILVDTKIYNIFFVIVS